MQCPKCRFENPSGSGFCAKCGTEIRPSTGDSSGGQTETFQTVLLKELQTGSTFAGRFQVVEELGRGGMGKVYKVFDAKTREKIALKLLKPEISSDEDAIERFGNELRFARKISHRNVCRMYDLGDDKGTHYITMEYVSGEDLKSMLRMMGQMSAGKTVYIARQICEGLAEAHRLGVVHRDLKPQNIMIDREGNVRIMDFGIARSLKMKGLTGAGVVIGTPEYMSPEQMEGKDADVRSDIYSLGVILYEMVAGKLPFEGETFVSIALKQKTETPRHPKELNPQLPDDLYRLILRCLDRDRERRFQSVDAILADLARIEKGVPTTEKVLPSVPTTSRQFTVSFTPRKLVVPALALGLVLLAVVVWLVLPSRKAGVFPEGGKPKLAVVHFRNMTGDPKMDPWKEGLPNLLIAGISQYPGIDVVGEDRMRSCLTRKNLLETESYTSENLADVADETGASHVVSGFFTRAGEELRLNIAIRNMRTDTPLGSEEVRGKGESSIFPMIDELKDRIKTCFGQSGSQLLVESSVGDITTSSPEAFKLYLEGRKFHMRTDYRRSIGFMEDAVKIDPDFAMAYRSMGSAYGNLGNDEKSLEYLDKALSLSARLTEKERLIIQITKYFVSREYSRAIEVTERLIKIDPNNIQVNSHLRAIYSAQEEDEKVIQYGEILKRAKSDFLSDYGEMAVAYASLGRYEKARESIQAYVPIGGDSAFIHDYLAVLYLCEGKYDEAAAEAEKAIALNPRSYSKGLIWYLRGEWEMFEKECERYLAMPEPSNQLMARYWLEILYRTQGRFRAALEQARLRYDLAKKQNSLEAMAVSQAQIAIDLLHLGESARARNESESAVEFADKNNLLNPRLGVRIIKGWTAIAQQDYATAERMADEYRKMVIAQTRPKKWVRYADALLGKIELERGNYTKAISVLEKARSLWHAQSSSVDNQSWPVYHLGLAHFRAGDMAEARKAFEIVTRMTVGRVSFGEQYAMSFYMLGQVFEKTGDKTRAGENYRKFLDLWKDADPGRPEVEDARKRLAGLR